MLLLFVLPTASACTNLLIGKDASGTGSPMIAYTSDAGWQYGAMGHYPAATHPPGTLRTIINEDSGAYAGQIPEAEQTFNALAYHGGMNEHQLAIGETTFGGLAILGGQQGLIDYGSLMDLALQRCKTAREAIVFMDSILNQYGYASSGESFSIADTSEVWLLEIVSKGPGERGAVWVAQKVPDDSVGAHSNHARIRTWPRDAAIAMWANDTVDFAVRKGLYPEDADPMDFSFSDVFCPVDFVGARLGEARAYNMLKEVADDPAFAAKYLDYAQGYNLTNRMPLFVRASRKISLNDTAWLMRTRFEGTWFDERKDVGAGPYHAEYRVRPLLWQSGGKKYTHERTVGVQQNAFHFVATPRGGMPAPLGGVLWMGCDDQSLAVRFPAYAASTAIPSTWIETPTQNRTVFKMRSSHWAFNLISNLAYTRWNEIAPVVQQRIVETEERFARELATMDALAASLIAAGNTTAAVRALTDFTVQTGDGLVDEWNSFFGELFVRFSDGFVASQLPRSAPVPTAPDYTPGGTSTVSVEEGGYDQAWYDRIAAEAGDKYHVPQEVLLIDPRLSTDRLKYM